MKSPREIAISIFLVVLSILMLYVSNINRCYSSYFGFYVYGYSKELFLPDIPSFIFFLIISIMVVSFTSDNSRSNKLLKLTAIAMFIFLYFYKLDADHFIFTDSYTLLANIVDIVDGFPVKYRYSITFAVFLAPFLVIYTDEFFVQLGIVFYWGVSLILLYRFLRRYFDSSVGYFIVILMQLNPLFVAITRTISYEPILILVFVVNLFFLDDFLRNLYADVHLKELRIIAMWFILVVISFVRFSYLLTIVLPTYVFLIINLLYRISKSEDVKVGTYFKGLLIILLLALIHMLLIFASLRLVKLLGVSSVVKKNQYSLIILLIGLSFVNMPPFRTGFVNYFLSTNNILIFNILLLPVWLFFVLKGFKNFYKLNAALSLYLVIILLANLYSFSMYIDFQVRYFYVSTFIFILFLGLGILSPEYQASSSRTINVGFQWFRKALKFLVILSIILALLNSSVLVSHWSNTAVRLANSSQIYREDVEEVVSLIMSFKGSKIILSSAGSSMLFYYRYRYKANYKIFELGDFFAKHLINWKSLRFVLKLIKHYLNLGYNVFYLATWPEIDDYRPPGYEFGYGWFYSKIKEASDYQLLLVGPYTYRLSWKHYAPIYELIIISDIYF